jgi:elongation factor G
MACKLMESVAEIDDALLERYFEDADSITKEEMHRCNSQSYH